MQVPLLPSSIDLGLNFACKSQNELDEEDFKRDGLTGRGSSASLLPVGLESCGACEPGTLLRFGILEDVCSYTHWEFSTD
ncbi:hypothetical protein P3T76_013611 [Phytophthora citrophthora]|uniref:Uncharacterized protein n=1 Tax=Phytophthora citrophthora TaxID=4793 RepID=A0AAD9G2Y6_9STRA|nr:hypothetical protein P3T76_013611 [Phytophthora citrophthora]